MIFISSLLSAALAWGHPNTGADSVVGQFTTAPGHGLEARATGAGATPVRPRYPLLVTGYTASPARAPGHGLEARATGAPVATRFTPVVDGHGVRWLRGPKGENVFSFGVCVVETGTQWADYDLKNPGYSAFQHYSDKAAWAKDTVGRLTSWGFNTIGAWSDYSALLASPDNHLYMTPILHIGSSAGAPWLDMWAPETVKIMDDVAKSQIQAFKKDARIIGYFSDNELGWWKGAMFHWVWEQKTHHTRQRVTDFIAKRYKNDWRAMSREFEPVGASSFAELKSKGALYLRPGAKAIPVVSAVLGMLAERYYGLCRSIIKKYDPGALFLGDRFISNYYPEVAEQAGKFCDVVSTNLNPDWTDGGFVRFHLDSLEALTNRPLMITEYYMCARQNRSGNANDHSGFPVVETQNERAKGFVNTTLAFAHNPHLVGAHWFQYYDEPKNGRGDGENYDFGLVDTSNKPYEELVAASKSLDIVREHGLAPGMPRGPLFIENPPSQWKPAPLSPAAIEDLAVWNRDMAFVRPQSWIPRGDMYCSWTAETLTIALYWHEERFGEGLYKSGKVPDSSCSTVEIDVPQTKTHWVLRCTDKGGVVLQGPKWRLRSKFDTSSHLIVQIPASAFGKPELLEGQEIELLAQIVSESRAYTTKWHATKRLEKTR